MPDKIRGYAKMADDTARKIAGDDLDWSSFLNTSSRLYKHRFHDQPMLYTLWPDDAAHSRPESLMSLLTRQEGVTEELKVRDQMVKVSKMNSLTQNSH